MARMLTTEQWFRGTALGSLGASACLPGQPSPKYGRRPERPDAGHGNPGARR